MTDDQIIRELTFRLKSIELNMEQALKIIEIVIRRIRK
jgi:hypothetical protein